MKTNTNNTTETKKNVLTKEEREERSKKYFEKRLESAKQRLNTIKETDTNKILGLANKTLKEVYKERANKISVDDLITSVLNLIKEVAKSSNVEKNIVGCLKKEAAKVISDNVTNETLCIYVDNKMMYKTETVYRLVCSKTKNEELKKLLNNLKKESDKQKESTK